MGRTKQYWGWYWKLRQGDKGDICAWMDLNENGKENMFLGGTGIVIDTHLHPPPPRAYGRGFRQLWLYCSEQILC